MKPVEIEAEIADLMRRKHSQGIEWPDIAEMVIVRLASFKRSDVIDAMSATGRPAQRRGASEGHQEYHCRRYEEMGSRALELAEWIDGFMLEKGFAPSTTEIAKHRGISNSTTIKYLRWLEENNYIVVERIKGKPIYRTLRLTYKTTESYEDGIEFE